MPIVVDAKGNISFTPDDIPAEIPEELIVPSVKPKDDSVIEGISIEPDEESQESESQESEPNQKVKVRTHILELYGDMTAEDLMMLFYNQEKPRAAEADDESLIRMQKEQFLTMEIVKTRLRVIKDEIDERETKRSRTKRNLQKLADSEFKLPTRIQKAAIEEQQNQIAKQKTQRERDIEKLMNALQIDKAEAETMYAKKKGGK